MTVRKSYFDGRVQSLPFTENGTDYTIGFIKSGEYEFDATRVEQIQVVFGDLVDLRDGKHYGGQKNPECNLPAFQAGEKVRIRAVGTVAYMCRYGG